MAPDTPLDESAARYERMIREYQRIKAEVERFVNEQAPPYLPLTEADRVFLKVNGISPL
jgi:hypothetical protein